MNKKIRAVGAAVLVAVWGLLTAFAWIRPSDDFSVAERRPLAKAPSVTGETLLNGKFTQSFEDYSLDQFPQRDDFRKVKSLFHYYVLGQRDNNGIYITDGIASKLEYPLNSPSVDNAIRKFTGLYNQYLKDTGSHVVAAIVPDKGYYLAEANGYPAMDYEALYSRMEEGMPFADFVRLTDLLTEDDYYRTDTHWRQERILPVAQRISEALGVNGPQKQDFTAVQAETPFYGVYYGQAALPMKPDTIYTMESEVLKNCQVYDFESQQYSDVYNREKLAGKDPYEVYLSGARALLRVENPKSTTDKELIVFRDSFGSSLTPLLVQDYQTVTLVDIRYIASEMLEQYLDFHGQDVLFLYNTLMINSSASLK